MNFLAGTCFFSFLFQFYGYSNQMLIEYDILSSAGNRSSAKKMIWFQSNSEYRTKEQWGKKITSLKKD